MEASVEVVEASMEVSTYFHVKQRNAPYPKRVDERKEALPPASFGCVRGGDSWHACRPDSWLQ